MGLRISLACLFAPGLVACAGPAYGSFLTGNGPWQAALGEDAAEKLARDYSPAGGASVWLYPKADDAFGRALSRGLRAHGFRLERGGDTAPAGALSVRYIADEVKDSPLLRVVVEVDGRRLSRAYRLTGQGAEAAGPWSAEPRPARGENSHE